MCSRGGSTGVDEEDASESVNAVRSVLYLYPKHGDYDTVIAYFLSARVLELSRESGGYLGGSIQVPSSKHGPLLVLATWRTEADYQRWAVSPQRAALTAGLLARLDRDPSIAETYSVAYELSG